MEEKIRKIVRSCTGLNHRAKMRHSISNNYDIIYKAMVDDGMHRLPAHTWTMLELERLHGRIKIERILECPVCG